MRICCLVVCIALAGCGGNHGDNETPSADEGPVRFAVVWPERTRDLAGSDGALAVKIDLRRAGEAHPRLAEIFDRATGTDSYVSDYVSASFVAPDAYVLKAEFMSRRQGNGIAIGQIDARVLVKTDGTLTDLNGQPLGLLSPRGLYNSFNIGLSDTVQVGKQSVLFATVTNDRNEGDSLSLGSISCSQIAGEEFATIAEDCTVSALTKGGPVAVKVDLGPLSQNFSFSVNF